MGKPGSHRKSFADFRRGESICRLSWKVFADFGSNNYTDCKYFRPQSMILTLSKFDTTLVIFARNGRVGVK